MAIKRMPVEASHIMMFARSIGDYNPTYYDEEQASAGEAGGIIAPPTFIQSSAQFDPDYPLRPSPDTPWFGSGKNPSGRVREQPKDDSADGGDAAKKKDDGGDGAKKKDGGSGGGLHAEQHFEYHRHPRPGDVLTAKIKAGRTWEKQSKRAGKLSFSEGITEYYDQHGELVITARGVGVRTERVIDEG